MAPKSHVGTKMQATLTNCICIKQLFYHWWIAKSKLCVNTVGSMKLKKNTKVLFFLNLNKCSLIQRLKVNVKMTYDFL